MAPKALRALHELRYRDMTCEQENINAYLAVLTANMRNLDCVQSGICEWEETHSDCDGSRRYTRQAETTLLTFEFALSVVDSRRPNEDTPSRKFVFKVHFYVYTAKKQRCNCL